jgi:hypothetical protein
MASRQRRSWRPRASWCSWTPRLSKLKAERTKQGERALALERVERDCASSAAQVEQDLSGYPEPLGLLEEWEQQQDDDEARMEEDDDASAVAVSFLLDDAKIFPSNQRATRQQAGGDRGAMWGAPAPATRGTSCTRRSSSSDAAYQPRARREPVEDSPSTKRAKQKQAELKKQGNQSEEAITLSSSDEEPEEEGDDDAGAGVISFLLDDEKIFFGLEAKPSAKRVQFTEDGLRMPAPEIWGDAEDADVVPYEEIESIKYGVGKHLFLSVSLLPDSTKLKALLLKVPRMKKSQYQEIHHSRILLPLRQNQMELFSERRQQIIDRYVKTALVYDEEKFFAAARPHQITDLLAGTPYKVRHTGLRLLAPPQAHHLTGLGLVLTRASSVVHRCGGGHLPRLLPPTVRRSWSTTRTTARAA